MRATGITWLAVAGLDATKIQRRAGHTTIETTMGYIREAESFAGEAFGQPFPPLPAELLGELDPSTLVAAGPAGGWTGHVSGVDGTRTRVARTQETPRKRLDPRSPRPPLTPKVLRARDRWRSPAVMSSSRIPNL